jgi:hypothetical protein
MAARWGRMTPPQCAHTQGLPDVRYHATWAVGDQHRRNAQGSTNLLQMVKIPDSDDGAHAPPLDKPARTFSSTSPAWCA